MLLIMSMSKPTPAVKPFKSQSRYSFESLRSLLQQGVDQQVFPGGVLLVNLNGENIFAEAVGNFTYTSEKEIEEQTLPSQVTIETVYDIGNLSSVISTAAILMRLVDEKRVNLDDKVIRYVQSFSVHGKADVTVRDLLRHTSGLAPWKPYYEELLRENTGKHMGILTSRGAREYIYNDINRGELKFPLRSRQVYSDIGLILLGSIIENLTGMSLDRSAQKYVFFPLEMRSSSYVDLALVKRRGLLPVREMVAPTETCSWRKKMLWGEVQDDNAWAMGGIAGNAGIFTNAPDVINFADNMLKTFSGRGSFVKTETLNEFWSAGEDERFALGWEKPSAENGFNESGLSDQAVGFSSNTGCTIWLEPNKNFSLVFLSNRSCPTRSNKKYLSFAPAMVRSVLESVRL
jgi:CubicO group peptidase (beta-lactamase class C family)